MMKRRAFLSGCSGLVAVALTGPQEGPRTRRNQLPLPGVGLHGERLREALRAPFPWGPTSLAQRQCAVNRDHEREWQELLILSPEAGSAST